MTRQSCLMEWVDGKPVREPLTDARIMEIFGVFDELDTILFGLMITLGVTEHNVPDSPFRDILILERERLQKWQDKWHDVMRPRTEQVTP